MPRPPLNDSMCFPRLNPDDGNECIKTFFVVHVNRSQSRMAGVTCVADDLTRSRILLIRNMPLTRIAGAVPDQCGYLIMQRSSDSSLRVSVRYAKTLAANSLNARCSQSVYTQGA